MPAVCAVPRSRSAGLTILIPAICPSADDFLIASAGAADQLGTDLRDRALASVRHGDAQLDAEQLERASHALLAGGRQAPDGHLADQDGPRAERQRLQHVGAALEAA